MPSDTKKLSCNTCDKREGCTSLCTPMKNLLDNNVKQNGSYSEVSHNINCVSLENFDIDHFLYCHDLSGIEERDVKRIVVSILTAEEKDILNKHALGLKQSEIASALGINQSTISRRLKSIKGKITKSLIMIMPRIA